MNTDNPLVNPDTLPLTFGFEPIKDIGDINSDERGSGARYNAGKVPLELIPAKIISDVYLISSKHDPVARPAYVDALDCLGLFQMRSLDEPAALAASLYYTGPLHEVFAEAAAVFDYGRKKYSAWNWSKGMPWSVPIGCAMRHIVFGPLAGEVYDEESGLPHRGHFACNIIMLMHYVHFYPEGDDRPRLPEKA